MERNIYKIGKELFITSDEVIKEGDWIYKIDHSYTAIFNVHCEELVDDYNRNNNNHKKIIMTTNKDLDGVQAIDAEFLEWFVKNPSFERVEVNIEGYPCMSDGSEITFAQPANLGGSEDIRNNIVSYNKQEHTDTKNFVKAYDKKRYKIIIPKEETKKEQKQHLIDIMNFDEEIGLYNESKQETLEEARKRISKDFSNTSFQDGVYHGVLEGAKWQARRMYSDLSELRNDLYNKLPISDVDAFEILKVIKNHLQKLDVLCGNK